MDIHGLELRLRWADIFSSVSRVSPFLSESDSQLIYKSNEHKAQFNFSSNLNSFSLSHHLTTSWNNDLGAKNPKNCRWKYFEGMFKQLRGEEKKNRKTPDSSHTQSPTSFCHYITANAHNPFLKK